MEIERIVSSIPGTKSVIAERTSGGYFVDFVLNREAMSRFGLSVEDLQMTLMSAIGGETVTQTIEGRERYTVNVRFPRELRDDLDALSRIPIVTSSGAQIPLSQLADIEIRLGPSMIRDENGRLAGYVYVDMAGRDMGGYVRDVKEALARQLKLPLGYSLVFSGQYEYMARVKARMRVVLPLTLFLIFLLLYFNVHSFVKTIIVLLAVPFSMIGAVWLLYLLGYNLSIGVWAGIIALLGVDAETGVIMLLYLDLAYEERRQKGQMRNLSDLKEAIMHGAVKRIRPKMMTVMTTFIGLLPILLAPSHETGADVMKRIAAPMVGGIFTSFIMELLVYPAVFLLWKLHGDIKKVKTQF